MALWSISGAAVESPLTNPCMRRLDCCSSWAIVPNNAWRLLVWCVMVAVVPSCLRSVCVLMLVVSVPNFSSNLSSKSLMVLARCFSVRVGLEWAALLIA